MFGWLLRWRRRRTLDRAGEFRSVLSHDATFRGVITGSENTVVYGGMEGDGLFESSLVLAAGSYWRGSITASHVFIAGRVEGDIVAREKLELAASAHVVGNLTSRRIAIAEGAVCEGMIHAPQDDGTTHFRERRVTASG